jgi:hypothetical protein
MTWPGASHRQAAAWFHCRQSAQVQNFMQWALSLHIITVTFLRLALIVK